MKTIHFYILFFISTTLLSQKYSDTLGNASLKREDSTTSKIIRLNINSNRSDFSPVVFNNQLLFVSGRNESNTITYIDKNGESEITDLFSSLRIDSIRFKNVKSFDATINTKYYEGPFCLNKKGNIIYFTATDKKTSLLKIYKSAYINNTWSKPEILSFCLPQYSYCHPSLSPNEELIVFASNINSEKNKMDLFISEYNDGIWSPAIAMSSKINDEANQIFPFINSKNILYYSSDKKTGKGGLDIYYTNLNSDTSSIKTFPFPINSSADDFGVWIDTTSETGYFSSNRNARYKDDIYYFSKRIPEFKNWKKINTKNTFCYNFYEERSLESKDTLDMVFEWDFGDGKKGRGLKIKHCFEKPGEYLIQLNTVNKVSGEVFVNETSSTLLIEKPDQLVIDCQDSINENQSLIIKTDNCYLKGYKLNEMYWSFGDGKYNSGPLVKHFYQTPGTYKIEVGLLAKNIDSDKIEKFKIEKNIIVTKKK